MRNIRSKKEKENTPRPTCSRNPLTCDFSNLSRRGLSLERFTPPIIEILRRLVHCSRMPLSIGGSSVHETSRTSSPKSRSPRRRDVRMRNIDDYDGGRTRILIFALAMFRVRPGVNWMLIAVDSWPYIRGTLSPSSPGGPSGPGPQVVYPHVTPLCSATTTTVPPSRATTTPLWDRRPTPPPLQIREPRRNVPLLLQRTGFVLFLLRRPLVRCLTSFFFSLVAYLRRYLGCALVLYDTFSEERRTYRYRRGLPLESEAADGTSIVSVCLPSSGERPD